MMIYLNQPAEAARSEAVVAELPTVGEAQLRSMAAPCLHSLKVHLQEESAPERAGCIRHAP